jgi:hypothetical protein
MASDLGILKGKYPAKAHAKKVAKFILDQGGDKNGVLYLEGQKVRMIEVSSLPFILPTFRIFPHAIGKDWSDFQAG